MSDDSKSDQPQIGESALKNFILLALPWLSFQLDLLELAKTTIRNAAVDPTHIRPTEKFTVHELHALMMIFDRSHEWRSLFDQNLEERLKDAYKEIFPKVASASVQIIEAQEMILSSVSEALQKLRKGDKANHHPNS